MYHKVPKLMLSHLCKGYANGQHWLNAGEINHLVCLKELISYPDNTFKVQEATHGRVLQPQEKTGLFSWVAKSTLFFYSCLSICVHHFQRKEKGQCPNYCTFQKKQRGREGNSGDFSPLKTGEYPDRVLIGSIGLIDCGQMLLVMEFSNPQPSCEKIFFRV